MEMQLFDTELDMAPVDMSQVPKETNDNGKETGKEAQEGLQISPNTGDTILETIIDKVEEKETEVEEGSKDTKKPASEQSADSSKFPYSTFAKALYEEGVLSFFDEDEFKKTVEEEGGELEALFTLTEKSVADRVEAYKNSLSPEGKEFLEALEKGVPLDKFVQSKTQEYAYLNIKEDALADNDDLCKRLIHDDLYLRGFSKDEIEDQIKDFDDLGKLETKAKTALKKLQIAHKEQLNAIKEEAAAQQRAAIEENKKQLATLKETIEKVTEIIPGVKLNPKLKAEIYDAITTPAEQMPNGQWVNSVYAKRAKDPIAWDMKVAYLDKLGVFDGKWDKVISGSKSAAVKELADKLKSGTVSATGDTPQVESTPTAKSILKSMEVFKSK